MANPDHIGSFAKPTKRVKSPKPMNKIGRIGKEWLTERQQWLKDNPPDHAGNYICVFCLKPVHVSVVTLDHTEERSRRPDLRLDPQNYGNPSHRVCNFEKRLSKQ